MFSVFVQNLIFTRNWQVMRMSTPHVTSTAVKERKVSQSASCKIDSIVRQLFLPMLSMPTPERTSFLAEDVEDQLLRQVAQERPDILATETDFVDYMIILYRKFQRESNVSESINFGMSRRKLSQAASAAVEIVVGGCDTEYESCHDSFDSNGDDAGHNCESIEDSVYQKHTETAGPEAQPFTVTSAIISEAPYSDESKIVSKSTPKSISKKVYSKTRVDNMSKSKSRAGQRSGPRCQKACSQAGDALPCDSDNV